jgi:DNA polymerase-1
MSETRLPEPGADQVIYLVDIFSYVFRAYYAIGHLSNSKGQPTGAVLGVTRMLQRLWKDQQPQHLAVAMDSPKPTWRKEMYEPYKANRPSPPPDLVEQIPLVQQMVEAYRIPIMQLDGFEADDCIATAVARAREAGLRCVVVTGDKDLMQLVDEYTVVYDTMKDKVWGPPEVEAKFGVPPSLVGDFLALTGDSSDNIPGVPSVGPKTATKLLQQYHSLTAILAAGSEIKGKLGTKIVDHADQARLSRELVELRKDVTIDFSLDALRFGSPDVPRLRSLWEGLEFRQLLAELPDALPDAPPSEAPRQYRTIHTREQLEQAIAEIREAGEVSVDLETTSLDAVQASIVGIALSWKEREGWYVPVGHSYLGVPEQLQRDEALELLRPLLEDPAIRVYGQNFKYDDIVFRQHGLKVAHVAFDTMMASYLLDPGKRSHGLDQLALDELGHRTMTYDEVTQKKRGSQLLFPEVEVDAATQYAGEDAEIVFTLVKKLAPRIDNEGFTSLLEDLELPLGRVLAKMELAGILVDQALLQRLSRDVGSQLLELQQQAEAAAGRTFNVNSPQQLAAVLFDDLGLPMVKKTKGKTARSTDIEVLTELAGLHPLPGIVLEYRQLAKLKGTYLEGLPRLVNRQTKRIHTSYNQAVAATGRLSSSEPNLQNIPIRTELGRQIRRAFIAAPGHRLLAADYSQVELRVLAHLSEDPLLVAAFQQEEDVHERTAREIFAVPPDQEVSSDQRRRAKAINFGVVYGKTEYGLAKELGITRKEATDFIADYFERYAGVKRFMDATIEGARDGASVHTLLGRRRFLPDLRSRNYSARTAAERMARNTPIQGTAADIMKLAMVRLSARLRREGLQARMLLTVHDEVVLEVPDSEAERVEKVVVEEMMGAAELHVPLVVDVGWGPTWAEAH